MPEIRNPVQRFFWENLTQGGLDLVDAAGVEKLVDHLEKHDINATAEVPMPAGVAGDVSSFERTALRDFLQQESWRGLLDDSGVAQLEQFLGVINGNTALGHGRDAVGEVPTGTVSNVIGRTPGIKLGDVASLFAREYADRKAELFENPALSEDDRAKNVLLLLQDYAKAIPGSDYGVSAMQARRDLLTAFFQTPLAQVYGAKDPDQDFLGTAWEIVSGTDPERPQNAFSIDKAKKWSAYLSMGGEFVPAAQKIDEFLAAQGLPANVLMYEKRSPLNWIVGDVTGNVKPASSFREDAAISSTGVDFARKLLGDESQVGTLTLDPAFDLKVDFLGHGNRFVSLDKGRGEKLVAVKDGTQQTLKVELQQVGDAHWKPVFKDAQGVEVPADQVTAVVQDAAGRLKGDGVAKGSYSASWWGFCDRNASQGQVTLKYGFPQPEKDVTLNVGDKAFTFSKSDIRLIVGRRLTELFPTSFAGNRFDDAWDQVNLRNGAVVTGKIQDKVNFYTQQTQRVGDMMSVRPGGEFGPRGSLWINDGTERDIPVSEIAEIRRAANARPDPVTGERPRDVVVLHSGEELQASILSKVSFDAAERQPDGSLVLRNDAASNLMGEISVKKPSGELQRVALSDVSYLTREDENEILAEEAMNYIIRNQGVFVADSWSGSSVANGTRTIDEITRWTPGSEGKPSWVPADPSKLEGYRGKVQNPDNVYFFGLGNKGSSASLQFWMELDENRVPINSGAISGKWDFLWGAEGQPDWTRRNELNPHVPNDLVLNLYVNSVADAEQMGHLLPSDWRKFVAATTPVA